MPLAGRKWIQVCIVVTGCEGLEKTAQYIQQHFKNASQEISVFHWKGGLKIAQEKPYILVIKEADLNSDEIKTIRPDVIVIKNLSHCSQDLQDSYLNLYTDIEPHVNTIFNGDDRASIELAVNAQIKKGRIFYFSKNRALEPQIKKIGGVVSDGEEVEIFGFNLKSEVVQLKLGRIMPYEDEIALLSSLGAVLTVGLDRAHLQRV